MALTASQRAEVRRYLGWSARFHQMDERLEHALAALDSLAEEEAQVLSLLSSIRQLETEMVQARRRLKALAIGKTQLTGWGEMAALRREGRRFVQQLAALLGVEKQSDVFGSYFMESNYVGR